MIEQLVFPVSMRDHVRGHDDAPVTLIEYGDFACPYCADAYPVVRRLLLSQSGRLRFVFRHNPRGELHEGAHLGALAAEAAGFQGQFWPMHDLLFQRTDRICERGMVSYARRLGLDIEQFQVDLHSRAVAARVREDQIAGLRSGVIGTPTFFLNAQHFRDKPDFDGLSRAIEAVALAAARGSTLPEALRA
jgi:protein-disulfide isomerase